MKKSIQHTVTLTMKHEEYAALQQICAEHATMIHIEEEQGDRHTFHATPYPKQFAPLSVKTLSKVRDFVMEIS